MWKFVARGIRETLERRACRTNIYSQPSQDNAKNEVKTSLICQQKFLAPIFVTYDKGFCGSTKSAGAKGKEHDYKWNAKHSWQEAFGWSSILAASWVVCQSLSLHKRIFNRNSSERKSNLIGYAEISHILTQLSNLQLKNILRVTNCVGNSKKNLNLQNSDAESSIEKQFGPITNEETLKDATDEFTKIHNIIIGELELYYGIKALEEKRHKDAWIHFSRGAKLSSPANMFNLGLCYELGIGTLVDQKKAAKYYNDAATYDHADALYNLGVFYAQGKGDLPINIDIARAYFTKAAKLGQVQAQHALNLEKVQQKKSTISIVPKDSFKNISLETNKANDMRNKADCNDKLNTNFTAESMHEVPGYNKEIVQDPTEIFLQFLGLKGSSQTSILINSNDCRVSC